MTSTALRDAAALGFDRAGVVETIAGIERRMFYKSMTTFADHRVWQDVYHVPARGMGSLREVPGGHHHRIRGHVFQEK
ncbi:type II toxin-antitoxin system MqsR family toxin [Sinorhizobium meliloti]|jgi:motility quorum-sensing regulator/GCU-specific mRNA interferase toxin|uniref:type II toxin-antitoxin system MqsR family toxin n=1 Tax=Rhizobium meliloti TaxID=382 RepID=UPI00200ADF97|nr:type II toxin-antitoxin system MqsR family toxin [Sinorhizobium meliloti]